MEIERKYLISILPKDLNSYEHHRIEQGYISTSPVIRIRRYDDKFILTIKGKGLLQREEFELFISEEEYLNLSKKVEGLVIKKVRYRIPYESYIIELDLFSHEYDGLVLGEVEFPSLKEANKFIPPSWFGQDVTENPEYQNSFLSKKNLMG